MSTDDGGVRTHECRSTLQLECNPLDHSGTSPKHADWYFTAYKQRPFSFRGVRCCGGRLCLENLPIPSVVLGRQRVWSFWGQKRRNDSRLGDREDVSRVVMAALRLSLSLFVALCFRLITHTPKSARIPK